MILVWPVIIAFGLAWLTGSPIVLVIAATLMMFMYCIDSFR